MPADANAPPDLREAGDRDRPLGPHEFAVALETALTENEETTTFLALLLVDVDVRRPVIVLPGATDPQDLVLDRVLEDREDGEAAGRQADGCLALLRANVLSPAAAIERCNRLLRTVRNAGPPPPGRRVASASVGLALAPGRRPGGAALLDGARRAMRTARREGGDQWAAA